MLRGTKYSRFSLRTEGADGVDCAGVGGAAAGVLATPLTSIAEKHRVLRGSLCAICLRSSESMVTGQVETNEKV